MDEAPGIDTNRDETFARVQIDVRAHTHVHVDRHAARERRTCDAREATGANAQAAKRWEEQRGRTCRCQPSRVVRGRRPEDVSSSSGRPKRSAKRAWKLTVATSRRRLPGATPPAHLKGTIAGDRGFDPLSLGVEPERLKWYTEAELYNGRWAMAGVFGIIHQEALGKAGLIKDIPWFNTGYELKDEFPIAAQLGVLFPLFGFLELTRYQGFKKTGECGVINMFPFDPLGMKSEKMKEREVKNGRLAMMAFVGFVVQAVVCRQGPLDCMYAHIADPFNNNILTNIVSPAGATYPGM